MMMILKFVFSDGSTERTPRRCTCDIDRCCVWWPANQCGLQPHFKIDLWVSTCEAWTEQEKITKLPTKLLIRYLTHGLAAVWYSQSELLASSSNFLKQGGRNLDERSNKNRDLWLLWIPKLYLSTLMSAFIVFSTTDSTYTSQLFYVLLLWILVYN